MYFIMSQLKYFRIFPGKKCSVLAFSGKKCWKAARLTSSCHPERNLILSASRVVTFLSPNMSREQFIKFFPKLKKFRKKLNNFNISPKKQTNILFLNCLWPKILVSSKTRTSLIFCVFMANFRTLCQVSKKATILLAANKLSWRLTFLNEPMKSFKYLRGVNHFLENKEGRGKCLRTRCWKVRKIRWKMQLHSSKH